MRMATSRLNLQSAGAAEMFRIDVNEQMADIFEETDFIFAATNPDVAFARPVQWHKWATRHGRGVWLRQSIGNNGALTIPANLTGNPAVSIPAGLVDGLPVGLQSSAPPRRTAVARPRSHRRARTSVAVVARRSSRGTAPSRLKVCANIRRGNVLLR